MHRLVLDVSFKVAGITTATENAQPIWHGI